MRFSVQLLRLMLLFYVYHEIYFYVVNKVERLFLVVPRGCLQFVIVVFPDHTHLLFFIKREKHQNLAF